MLAMKPNGPRIKQVTVPLQRHGAVFAPSERFFCQFWWDICKYRDTGNLFYSRVI